MSRGGDSGLRRSVAPNLGPAGYAPRSLAVPAIVGLALLVLPLAALVGHVDYGTFWADVTSPVALSALGLSFLTASLATIVCLIVGMPLAVLIARSGPRVAALLRAIVTVPLVLPPMVGGVALLMLLGRRGWLGGALSAFGIQLPFTTAAVVIAQVFVALPFLVLSLEGALRAVGVEYERTAAALGAGRWAVLWRITLPLAAPGLIAGTVLSFARALGEFGATALFAGNAPGTTQTMPLAIYTAFNGGGVTQNASLALSLLLLSAAVLVLVLVRGWRGEGAAGGAAGGGAGGGASPGIHSGGVARPSGRGALPAPRTAAPVGTGRFAGESPVFGGVHLDAHVRVERGGFALDVDLAVAPGETLAIMGPSGAGKSTLLGAIAGLVPLSEGRISVTDASVANASVTDASGERVLDDTRTGRRTPLGRRRVVSLRQDAALFPHLSARDNVVFALRHGADRPARAEARALAEAGLARVGLAGFGTRRPAELSGGQAQRVALARALAARPRVLLLDEPFASLDSETIADVRLAVRDVIAQAGVTTIVATHSIDDALTLAPRLAVIEAGRIVQQRPTRAALRQPASGFVAAMAGLNRVAVMRDAEGVWRAGGLRITGAEASAAAGADVVAVFPTDAVRVTPAALADDTGQAAPAPADTAEVVSVEPSLRGWRVRTRHPSLVIDVTEAEDLSTAVGDAPWRPGDRVVLPVSADDATFVPPLSTPGG